MQNNARRNIRYFFSDAMLENQTKRIVILEKDHTRRDYLRSILEADSGLAFCFDKVSACFDNLSRLNPDLILVGRIPRSGIYRFINAHSATDCELPSLLMTQDQAIRKYIEVGGVSNITINDAQLDSSTINRLVEEVLTENKKQVPNNDRPFIVGKSPCVDNIRQILPELIATRECVLIEGENGTGKEMVARAIHKQSESQDLFIKISAQDLQPDMTPVGLLEIIRKTIPQADLAFADLSATVFIRELGYLNYALQAEILNLIECLPKLWRRPAPLRVIASTSVGSDILQAENRLRKDLYFRLNVLNLKIDPLRKRKEDIPLLTDYFSFQYCKLLGRGFFEMPEDTMDLFLNYHWPGNTRELESVVKRAVINGDGGQFLKNIQDMRKGNPSPQEQILLEGAATIDTLVGAKEYLAQAEQRPLKEICSRFMARVEITVMKKALVATNWNRKKAAQMLNISYKSMLNKIKEYGLA